MVERRKEGRKEGKKGLHSCTCLRGQVSDHPKYDGRQPGHGCRQTRVRTVVKANVSDSQVGRPVAWRGSVINIAAFRKIKQRDSSDTNKAAQAARHLCGAFRCMAKPRVLRLTAVR
eukprot:1145909-Pelagomonas_calceolata.AAC.4